MRQIIKVGGSLCDETRWPEVLAWLMLVGAKTPSLIVPGGGQYADTVRACQNALGVSDQAAHRQALLAMEQTAYLIQDGIERQFAQVLPIVSSWSSDLAIWTPRAWLNDESLPATWRLTSDSLALILATRLGVDRLILLKSIEEVPPASQVADWALAGWVDPLFTHYAKEFPGEIRLLAQADWGTLKSDR